MFIITDQWLVILTSVFKKLIEKIILKQLTAFNNSFDLITDLQQGFRKSNSTISPAVEFVHTAGD